MTTRTYEKLIVWQAADDLCLQTCDLTKKFPSSEKFTLAQQMRKASYGVPMCIVEGNMRRTDKDKSHFFVMALGSFEELHYQYSLACRIGFIDKQTFEVIDQKVGRVSFLLHKLKASFN